MVVYLHKHEPGHLQFAMVDLIPNEGRVVFVVMLYFFHDSPRHPHVTIVNLIPNPSVEFLIAGTTGQRIAVMMPDLL